MFRLKAGQPSPLLLKATTTFCRLQREDLGILNNGTPFLELSIANVRGVKEAATQTKYRYHASTFSYDRATYQQIEPPPTIPPQTHPKLSTLLVNFLPSPSKCVRPYRSGSSIVQSRLFFGRVRTIHGSVVVVETVRRAFLARPGVRPPPAASMEASVSTKATDLIFNLASKPGIFNLIVRTSSIPALAWELQYSAFSAAFQADVPSLGASWMPVRLTDDVNHSFLSM